MADCKRKTANLLNPSVLADGYHLDTTTGLPTQRGSNDRVATLTPIDVSNISAVTLSYLCAIDDANFMYSIFDANDTLLARVTAKHSGDSIDVSNAAKLYIAFYGNSAVTISSLSQVMLNSGSTPLPYEPYYVHSLRKFGTDTDTLTTLPADVYADGQPIGANLFDGAYIKGFIGTTYIFRNTGTSANCAIIPVSPNTTYTVTKYDESNRFAIGTSSVLPYDEIQLTGVYYVDTATTYTFTTDNSAQYMVVYVSTGTEQAEPRLMVNTGSTALPYQPYAPTIIKGNMSQTGSPTPSSPIQPSECGDLSPNLFNKNNPAIFMGYYNSTTNELANNANNAFIYIPIVQGKKYYVYGAKRYNPSVTMRWVTTTSTPNHGVSCIRTNTFAQTDICAITAESNENYLAIFVCGDSDYAGYGSVGAAITANCDDLVIDNGYKLDIKSGSTTTPVYLGEVQTTRVIKELVLTGDNTENWQAATGNAPFLLYLDDMLKTASGNTLNWLSNQYIAVTPSDSWSRYDYCITSTADRQYLRFRDIRYNSLDDFKAYLAAQYAAGTPVTVWYVLSSAITGIVNEPIRKIGNYADTVSNITIPTITGKDTVDVETTLKPSEVELTYTGWHDAEVKEAVRTVNIYDKYNILDIPGLGIRYGIECELGTYSIYNNTNNSVIWGTNDWASRHLACEPHSTTTITIQGTGVSGFLMGYNDDSLGEITIVQGSTVPDHYIPYIDWN